MFSSAQCYGAEEYTNSISVENIIRNSRPYYEDENVKVTREDLAVWVMQIINKIKDNSYNYRSYNDENKSELLKEAIKEGFLPQYSSSGKADFLQNLRVPATREETCYMIQKAFCDNVKSRKRLLYNYVDNRSVSQWAWDSVSDIVSIIKDTNSNYLIKEKIGAKQTVLEADVINILDPVLRAESEELESKYHHKPDPKPNKFKQCVQDLKNMFKSLFKSLIVSIIGSYLSLFFQYLWTRKRVIYIGANDTGKKSLRLAISKANKSTHEKRGFRKLKKNCVLISENREVIVNGKVIEFFESSMAYGKKIKKAISKKRIIPKYAIVVLVLAHNQTKDSTAQDNAFIQQQLEDLEEYIKIIKDNANKVDKLLLFINKCDILECNDNINETVETIYRDHIQSIKDINGISFKYKAGSAANGDGINEFREMLCE